jgi:hypothetical protein
MKTFEELRANQINIKWFHSVQSDAFTHNGEHLVVWTYDVTGHLIERINNHNDIIFWLPTDSINTLKLRFHNENSIF